jgi:ABC-type polysaccharide/polyol phosphate export permease
MAQSIDAAEGPPPELRFKRRINPATALKELWRARELIRSVAERDIRVRYKQASLGVAWAVLAPLAMMLVLTLFIRRLIEVPTGGIPYPLFVYLAIVPWAFFASSVSHGGGSLLANKGLLNRIYCPREVFPIASVVVAAIDMAMAFLALGILFPVTGFWP